MRRLEQSAFFLACRTPQSIVRFSPDAWNQALMTARSERLLARLSYRIEDAGVFGSCPASVRDMLTAARVYPDYLHAQALRELRHLRLAVEPLDVDLILLKGVAYLSGGLPLSRGRPLRDLDVLVRRERIAAVEARLIASGWECQVEASYDQRYYRDWMHEIPALRHPERGLELDVHHTLLPLTGRLHPNPDLLWESAIPLAGIPQVYVLSQPDMVLHTSAHLFYDGAIRGGLGDLWDIDELLRLFAPRPDFWDELLARAQRMQLGRPLYYGLTFAHRLMSTPIPGPVLDEARARFAPNPTTERIMRRLIERVLTSGSEDATPVSDWLLFVRSHWLRMPPHILIPHLARKMIRRIGSSGETDLQAERAIFEKDA